MSDNTSLKKFLAHTETKRELTVYLSGYVAESLEAINKKYCVVYETYCRSNILDMAPEMMEHDQEEADTIMILHAIDVSQRNSSSELYISSPDTGVFLLSIYYFPQIITKTFLRTGKRINARDIDLIKAYQALGAKRAKSLPGFHALTGCDVTSKFSSITKAACWKTFMEADDVGKGLVMYVTNQYCPKSPKDVNDLSRVTMAYV